MRELYVGSLAHVTAAVFPDSFDYLALGHLHVPQKVHGSDRDTLQRFSAANGVRGGRAQEERVPG